jgi:phosphatidylinositol kinase/protein kinase (PI-3  family)
MDGLKKKYKNFKSLLDFYKNVFDKNFTKAQANFIESMAAYSIFCYFLQVKDRFFFFFLFF